MVCRQMRYLVFSMVLLTIRAMARAGVLPLLAMVTRDKNLLVTWWTLKLEKSSQILVKK